MKSGKLSRSSVPRPRNSHKQALAQSLLIITGSMGAGKTAVLAEASDILSQLRLAHAAIDVDALGLAHLPSAEPGDGATYENLRSICKNYASRGVRRFLLALAIEDAAQLKLCRNMIPATETLVCRLTASIEAMEQRVKIRETGILRQDYVSRVAVLTTILDRARLEDFTVSNENRSLTEVASEMLVKARWISA
ncbi:MAG TPA: hypothetical protein VGU63_12755 [Candidatus Acidoferrales bacterium]|nr:hypothetical protein [Candidatus Acidoferrales bacterium]